MSPPRTPAKRVHIVAYATSTDLNALCDDTTKSSTVPRSRFSRRMPKQKTFCRPLVECHPLSMFAAVGPPRSCLVLGYGAIATEDIDKGLRRLRSSFDG